MSDAKISNDGIIRVALRVLTACNAAGVEHDTRPLETLGVLASWSVDRSAMVRAGQIAKAACAEEQRTRATRPHDWLWSTAVTCVYSAAQVLHQRQAGHFCDKLLVHWRTSATSTLFHYHRLHATPLTHDETVALVDRIASGEE